MPGVNWFQELQGPTCVAFYRPKLVHDNHPEEELGLRTPPTFSVARPSPAHYRLVVCIAKLGDWSLKGGRIGCSEPMTVLCLIPGVGATHTMWFPVLGALNRQLAASKAPRGRWVACLIDNRGSGGSDGYPPMPAGCWRSTATKRQYRKWWSVDALANDAWVVLENLIALFRAQERVSEEVALRIVLAGHSLGSAVVCRMLLGGRRQLAVSGVLFMSMHRGWRRDWFPPSLRALGASIRYLWWYLHVSAFSLLSPTDQKRLVALLGRRASIDLSLHLSDRFLTERLDPRPPDQTTDLIYPAAVANEEAAQVDESAAADAVERQNQIQSRSSVLRRYHWFHQQYVTDAYKQLPSWKTKVDDLHSSVKLAEFLSLSGTLGQLHAARRYRLTRSDLARLREQVPPMTMLVYGQADPLTLPRSCRAFAHALNIPAIELPGAHLITEESKLQLARFMLLLLYDT
jgi:hypothetical protein